MEQRPLEVETLLAQQAWLRSLAIRLVYDENRADDLVQQVWVQALERPPRREGSVRGWLGSVLRSRWRDQQRSEAARGARERATHEARAAPATAEIAARIEAQQVVARAVLELEEPLREVVLLHFFEELPVREVARRLGIPFETARHRLARALETLRFRLRETHGDEGSRRLALLLVGSATGADPAGAAARTGSRARWIAAAAFSLVVASALVVALRPSAEGEAPRGSSGNETSTAALPVAAPRSPPIVETPPSQTQPASDPRTPRTRAEVRVRTSAGDAVAGASVEAWMLPARIDGVSQRVAAATTDRDGRARLDGLAPGRFTFVARAAGHAVASAESRRLEATAEPHRLDLVVGAGHALAGRVTDERGRAVPGAVLAAEPPRSPWDHSRSALRVETTADGDGRYAFDALAPGETTLSAGFAGGVPVPVATLVVPSVPTFDIQLRRGGSVSGRVTDAATSAPVSGADVTVHCFTTGDVVFGRAVTGADGEYAIDALVECVVRQVVAEKDGYAIDALADARLPPTAVFALPRGATVTRDLVLRRGGRLSGRVTGPAGPVAGAAVSVTFVNRLSLWTVREATTGDDGRYAALHVAEGPAFVRVEAKGLKEAVLADPKVATSMSLEPYQVQVAEGGEATFDVAMIVDDAAAAPLGRVRGAIVDETGATPRDACVEVLPTAQGATAGFASGRTFVGADGSFDLAPSPPPAKACRVRAWAPGFAETWSAEVATASLDGAAPMQLRLERGAPLAGVVRREGTGEPVAHAEVHVLTPAENGRFARRAFAPSSPVVALTDGDGRFIVSDLRTGTFEVSVQGPDSIAALRSVEVPAAAAVAFELTASLDLDGRVAFADGTGLPGVQVVAAPETRPKSPNPAARTSDATTALDGSFVLRGLAPGRYRLRVVSAWDRSLSFTQPAPEPVEAGAHDARVLVERALEIAGRVLDSAGRPAHGTSVTLEAPGARVEPVGTGPDGTFAFVGLREGTFTVAARTVVPLGADVAIARREGVAAGTRGIELVLAPALSIEGVVLDAEGREIPGLAVQAVPVDRPPTEESRGFQPVGAGGHFALRGLAPGSYELGVGNLRDRLRPMAIHGRREFAAGTGDVRLEVRPALTASGRLLDAAGAPLANRTIELVPDDASWPRRRVRTSATGEFSCDGLGPGRHRATVLEGEGDAVKRVPCGECDAGAVGVEWRLR